jgi:sarcosine oxidase subunit beta
MSARGLSLPRTADVVVIGGGIVGCATAFFLSQSGRSPVLLERAPALAAATTAASAHCIRAQFDDPVNIAMMRESLDIFANFADRLDLPPVDADIGLTQQGYLFASTDPAQVGPFADRVARQQRMGLADVELIDGDEARRRYPFLTPEIVAATFRAADGWIDGRRAAALFARASGAPVHLGVTVTEIGRTDGRVTGVLTDAGRIATGTVVLATGPFAGALAGEALPISLLRRNRVIIAADPMIPVNAPLVIDADTGAHWRPHAGGALLAWGQPEAPSAATFPVAPDPAFPDLVLRDPRGVGRLSPFWRALAATLTPDMIDLAAGQYTMTPDHKPLIGEANETSGLWLHTGYSGHGIMGSPSGARLLANLITGRADSDHPFGPARFGDGTPLAAEALVL